MTLHPPMSTRTDTLFSLPDALPIYYPEERLKPQKILINMELWVAETPGRPPRDYSEVVCYEQLVTSAKALLAEGHVDLVETLAEQLAVLRSEERRLGKECVSTCRSRWSPYH